VRHPPGDDRIVLHAGWNAAGHSLAATTRGLEYWDGTRWVLLPSEQLPPAGALRLVERTGAATWVVAGAGGTLFEYSRDGLRELFRGPDASETFNAISADFEDISVVVGGKPGSPPRLHAIVGKHWLRPLPVPEAAIITALARFSEDSWLVIGRGSDGLPFAARYRPLDWQLERLPVPEGRVLLGIAARQERKRAIAVGMGGAAIEIQDGQVSPQSHANPPDLSCVAIDTLGRHWAAGPGKVWSRRTSGPWNCVWDHAAWQPPFVSIMAEVGTIIAMTVDGAVLECRSVLLDKTVPAM